MNKKKVSQQNYNMIYNAAVGICMPLVMCIFVTLANHGIKAGFLIYYLRTFIVSAVMSVPVSMVVMPTLTKIFRLLLQTENDVTIKDISAK